MYTQECPYRLLGPSFVLDILRPIGKGANGQVFACRLHGSSESLAVKVARIQNLENAQLLEKQIERMSALPRHPNIVRVDRLKARSQKKIYFLMERCEGSLDSCFQKLGQLDIIRLFSDLLAGLSFLNAQGIVHNDIKPANILFRDGKFKLTDFAYSSCKFVAKGQFQRGGTIFYLAPERLYPDYVSDFGSDIFSLGVVLFLLVKKQHPFISYEVNDAYKYLKLVRCKEPSLRVRASDPSIDEDDFRAFTQLILRMITAEPKERATLRDLQEFYLNSKLVKQAEQAERGPSLKKVPSSQEESVRLNHESVVELVPLEEVDRSKLALEEGLTRLREYEKMSELISLITGEIQLDKDTHNCKEVDRLVRAGLELCLVLMREVDGLASRLGLAFADEVLNVLNKARERAELNSKYLRGRLKLGEQKRRPASELREEFREAAMRVMESYTVLLEEWQPGKRERRALIKVLRVGVLLEYLEGRLSAQEVEDQLDQCEGTEYGRLLEGVLNLCRDYRIASIVAVKEDEDYELIESVQG